MVSLESFASLASRGRAELKADKFGQFMFTVGSGNYTIATSKKHSITSTRNVSVTDNIERGTRADIILSRKLARGKSYLIYTISQVDFTVIFYEIRYVENCDWMGRAKPRLDAYLKLPEGDYLLAVDKRECKHPEKRVISYDCKKLFYSSAIASLDLDNRTAYSIETITGISDLISAI